jgi:hypothetical protein
VQEKKVVTLTMLVTADYKPTTGWPAVDIVLTREEEVTGRSRAKEEDQHKRRRKTQFTGPWRIAML